jgi:hypothetical protein
LISLLRKLDFKTIRMYYWKNEKVLIEQLILLRWNIFVFQRIFCMAQENEKSGRLDVDPTTKNDDLEISKI